MVDTSIVAVAVIAENVLVKIGKLTIPADFHVIRATKGDKGGTPQVLLGRPFLKTSSFQLDYVDETFSFKVGNVTEIFHPARPVAPRKKSAQQMQLCNDEVRGENAPIEAEGKKSESSMDEIEEEKGLRNTPPKVKKKKRKE
ncbi:MAG: hypothetical protein Q8875_03140, partial [Pigeon pea little leaf phytoplasma]|nr:hypothetical protein [Pigeon pea little leaf phytoplasma]